MIIAIGGQKGGAGKSTITASLAVALFDRGDDVLLLDCDPQGSLATWHEVGTEKGEKLPPLQLLNEQQMRELVPELRTSKKTILVDLDGRNSVAQRIALAHAHVFILPVRSAGFDIWALGDMFDLIAAAKDQAVNPELHAALLFNAQQRTVLKRTLARGLHGDNYLPIFDTELGHLIAYQESIIMGSGPTRTVPTEAAAKQIRQLVRELDVLLQAQNKEKTVEAASSTPSKKSRKQA
jgi:chromosome partitioning protein